MKGFNNKIWVFGAIATVLLIVVIMPSIPFSSANTITICDGDSELIIGETYDDLMVTSDDECRMKQVTINGNLYIGSGAIFTLSQSEVVGNIQADGATTVILTRVIVGGNIQIKNMDDDSGRVSLVLVGVDRFKNIIPVVGNVEIEDNSGSSVQINNSHITGNLKFIKNTSSSNKIFNNNIGGSLDCGTDNSNIVTFKNNVVTGAETGPCVPLV